MKTKKSIEEKIEDIAKTWLSKAKIKYFAKNESINSEIDNALRNAPSKSGGRGQNFPDIKLLVQFPTLGFVPVMIEVKGKPDNLIKLDEMGRVDNVTKDGVPNYASIKKFAVNGAVHYAEAILKEPSYPAVIAIGINGYVNPTGEINTEMRVFYVSRDNLLVPKEIDTYSDLSFLANNHLAELEEKIKSLNLTEAELEMRSRDFENQIEITLKKLNQRMHDELNIAVGSRVQLVAGLIMAGLGVPGTVLPLRSSELLGQMGDGSNDGRLVVNKVSDFLNNRNLPQEKKELIIRDLTNILIPTKLYVPRNGESPIKTVYAVIESEIMPLFKSARHLDFTGRLFNVLNEWVNIPDGEKNDVVLTPRYVCELMAKLCRVNKNSYVWDYATGSAGFLISAMKLMLQDAKNTINSPQELAIKEAQIKYEQLLGVEKRADIYMLAVLNMILMGDGSTNILHKDSLTEFDGQYEMGEHRGQNFPANVFLLNPPYSADGKGFVFVQKALAKMAGGRAAILIQENAGSGNGLPYTAEILKKNTLVASIHMADIFRGKAGVQTAIYVFDVGTPHNPFQQVKFIDFSSDGYARQNRKKSGADVNLRNTDNATERYAEIVDIVLGHKKKTHYFDDCVIIDTIGLDGNDWTYNQHKKIDTTPTEADFRKTVSDYLSWRVACLMRDEDSENF